jgi:hypothetical protein
MYVWITGLKLFADILLLVVAHRVCTCMMSRYREKLAAYWLLTGDFLTITLAAIALYYIGSSAATEILFLNEADNSLVRDISGRELKLQAAFYSVQAGLSIFVLVGAILHIIRCAKVVGYPLSVSSHSHFLQISKEACQVLIIFLSAHSSCFQGDRIHLYPQSL